MGKKDKSAVKIPEGQLVKAIAELEEHFEKGDALAEHDPEGGLGAEGTPLSAAVNKKTGVSKAHSESSSMSSDDDDDDDDDNRSSHAKSMAKAASASDDGDEYDDSAEKSFRDTADEDEMMAKAIEISPFLESLVDQLSLAILSMTKSFQKSISDLEGRINARLDTRVAKGFSLQTEFNGRVAKALTAIGESVQEQTDVVKSFGNQPAAPRGRAILSKSDVSIGQPPWQGVQHQQDPRGHAIGSEGNFAADLADVPPEKIGDWLFQKSCTNQIDPKLIMAWEADHYSIEALPENVQKSLVNDLCK
jgi:hypothetical protein